MKHLPNRLASYLVNTMSMDYVSEREQIRVKQYLRAYRELPETEEDVAFAEATAQTVFADNPWEDDGEE